MQEGRFAGISDSQGLHERGHDIRSLESESESLVSVHDACVCDPSRMQAVIASGAIPYNHRLAPTSARRTCQSRQKLRASTTSYPSKARILISTQIADEVGRLSAGTNGPDCNIGDETRLSRR